MSTNWFAVAIRPIRVSSDPFTPDPGGNNVDSFDFLTSLTDMLTSLLAFIFEWIGMALDTSRAHMDNSIR